MVVFIDDILIYSKTLENHTHHLRTVLETLRKKDLYVKLTNCEFWIGQVAFLGYVVSNEGVSVERQKIKGITKWPTPKNPTESDKFLRLGEVLS